MTTLDNIARQQLLQRIYDKMTDEERSTFVMMALQQRRTENIIRAITERQHRETIQALYAQQEQVDRMAQKMERQNWMTDFGSDVAANLFTDGLIYLAHRLLK